MKPEKSPVRLEIEREVSAVLSGATQALTTAELIEVCPTAQDRTELAKILNLMELEGLVERDAPRQPGEPGGMSGRGARAVNTWRLAKNVSVDAIAAARMRQAEEDDAEACLDTAAQSSNGDEASRVWAHSSSAIDDALRGAFAELPLYDGLHDAEDSTNGDEFTKNVELRANIALAKRFSDAALIDLANALLRGDPAWDAARRMHDQIVALSELAQP